jgi:hypothetical protein
MMRTVQDQSARAPHNPVRGLNRANQSWGGIMRRYLLALLLAVAFLIVAPVSAFATGQPGTSNGVNCLSGNATMTPGHSASSTGAPFNETSGTAGPRYAGSSGTPSAANGSSNAVSQYDIACKQVTSH